MANGAKETKVITGKVRLSYVHLFEPYSPDEDKAPRYSCVILIPKTDKATMRSIREAQKAALENGVSSVFGGKLPREWHDTIKDGDDEDQTDLERNPEYAGHWYMSIAAKTKPGIVDQRREPITDSSDVYSGCYARISMNAFAYNVKGNKGVSFGLNHVQKWADGDFLGGRSRAEDEFDDLDDDGYGDEDSVI